MKPLTGAMKRTLAKIGRHQDGVLLSDLNERTVNALVGRELVRVVWTDVIKTPKGRTFPPHQRVVLTDKSKTEPPKRLTES